MSIHIYCQDVDGRFSDAPGTWIDATADALQDVDSVAPSVGPAWSVLYWALRWWRMGQNVRIEFTQDEECSGESASGS